MGWEGAERAVLICGVMRPLSAPGLRANWPAGVATPTPHTQASQALTQDMHTTYHTEMVLTGELGAQNWCLLGDRREGFSGVGWEGFCLRQGDPMGCTAQGCWSPPARAKRK